MVLSGTGAGGASVGTPIDYGVGVWSFPISGLSIGTVDVDLAPDAGDITYTSGGANISAKEWSFTSMPGVTLTAGALDVDGTSLIVPRADRGLNVSAVYVVAA